MLVKEGVGTSQSLVLTLTGRKTIYRAYVAGDREIDLAHDIDRSNRFSLHARFARMCEPQSHNDCSLRRGVFLCRQLHRLLDYWRFFRGLTTRGHNLPPASAGSPV